MAYLPENPVWESGIYQYEITDKLQSGPGAIDNLQGNQLANRTGYLKNAVEAEAADRAASDENLRQQIDVNTEGIQANTSKINAMKGRGGYLMAHDFGTAAPSQQELINYALSQIHSDDPLEIWNGTHVKNTYVDPATIDDEHPNGIPNNHVWVLNNTPDTDPPILEWEDDGFDSVSIGDNNGNLGVVTGSLEEGYASIEPATGKIKLNIPTGIVSANSLAVIARFTPFAIATGKRQITIRRGTYIPVTISGVDRWFRADSDIILNVEDILGGSLQNGKDYSIFLVPDGTGLDIKIDTADVPDGYTADQVCKMIGFHTLCVDAGTGMGYILGGNQFDHPLNGYIAGDILPESVWCLNHRPHSEPEGMVYIPSLDFWCDIYLQSGSGANTRSVYQGAITRTRQYVDFVEDQFCVRKELLDDGEFAAAMLGSNEQTAVLGASESGATSGGAGGRKDTANRRMISIYGVEEGCGSIWQWLRSTSAGGAAGSMHGQTAATPTYGWLNMTTSGYGPYGQAGGKGSFWGLTAVLLAGGHWSDGASCGSRARFANNGRSYANSSIGGRGRRHRGGAYANSTAGHTTLSSCIVNRQNTKQRGRVVSIPLGEKATRFVF